MLGYSLETGDFCVFSGCPPDVPFAGPGGSGDLPSTVSTVVYVAEVDAVVAVIVTSNVDMPVEGLTGDVLLTLQHS